MAITSLDTYIAAAKQNVNWAKTAALTCVANVSFSPFAIAGDPGAGTLAGTSTAAGVVPTDGTAGCPTINAFGGGATGYLAGATATSSVACRINLYDMLWKGGAYAFNANTAVTSPSWSSRIPGGTDYTGVEIWMEQVTAGTLVQNATVLYTDSADVGKSTGAVSAGLAAIVGRCTRLGLAAGGTSVKTITNVQGTVASAGTFNILVLRPLWEAYIPLATFSVTDDLLKTGMPQVFADSALFCLVTPLSTALGIPMCTFEIANG